MPDAPCDSQPLPLPLPREAHAPKRASPRAAGRAPHASLGTEGEREMVDSSFAAAITHEPLHAATREAVSVAAAGATFLEEQASSPGLTRRRFEWEC
eukprot:3074088-Rhodomonas_salina.1